MDLSNFINPFDAEGSFAQQFLDKSNILDKSDILKSPWQTNKETEDKTIISFSGKIIRLYDESSPVHIKVYNNRSYPNPFPIPVYDKEHEKLTGESRRPMTTGELLDRAHWSFGEGGGQFLRYYAHAINNLRGYGYSIYTNFANEEAFKKFGWVDESGGYPNIKLRREYAKNDDGSITFNDVRKSATKLNVFATRWGTARQAISENIKALLGDTTDPTNGAYRWLGGEGNQIDVSNSSQYTGVIKLNKDGYYHTFYRNVE